MIFITALTVRQSTTQLDKKAPVAYISFYNRLCVVRYCRPGTKDRGYLDTSRRRLFLKRTIYTLIAVLTTLVILLTGCPQPDDGNTKGPITVGSKIDIEGPILAQMMILMLRDNGFEVIDQSSFGTTPIIRKALESDEIDMYPEYTGNGAFFFDEAGSDVWKDLDDGYARVKELDLAAYDIVWLKPAPVTNDWAIAIPADLANANNLVTLDDFAAYVNGGGYVKLIGSEEFINSDAGLPNFYQAYGFTLSQDQIITVAGGDTTLTEKAAAEGTDGVNAAMAYTTDGGLSAFNLVVLADNRGVNPIYAPAPRVRGEIMDKFPEIAGILNPVFESLDLVTLQTLNARMAVDGEDAAAIARDYLTSQGFLD